MFTLYCIVLGILFFLLNKAFDYLYNSDFTTYCIQGVSQRYSPPLELNPKGLGKKQKYCYKLY